MLFKKLRKDPIKILFEVKKLNNSSGEYTNPHSLHDKDDSVTILA